MIFNKSKFNTHWNTLSLDELGKFTRGKSKHRPRNDISLFEYGIYPLVQTGEIKDANLYVNSHSVCYNEFGLKQSKLWDKGTLCITIAANIAETAILGYPMCFPDSIVGFNSFKGKSIEVFVHYIFTYIRKAIQNAASGSIQDNINIDFLTKLKLKIPEFPTQQKIASVLSALDDKIEMNNQVNAELEAMAKTLYDYWFVQFEFPTAQGRGYKSSGGKMLFNEVLKREIPEGWEVKSLFEIAKVQYGFPFSTDYFNEDNIGVPVIRIRDILNNSVSNHSSQTNLDQKYLINKGDILIGMDGNFHINYWSKEDCYLNQRVVMIKETMLPNIYTRYQIEPFIQLREKSVSRTTVGHLSDKDLKAVNVCIPSENVLKKIQPLFNSILVKTISNLQQNQQLATLRDWLLPMLMNGQVKVG